MKKLVAALLLAFSVGTVALTNSSAAFNNENAIVLADSIDAATFIEHFKEFRKKHPNICEDSARDDFVVIYNEYISLSAEDKEIVDKTQDVDGYTIKDSIKVLVNKFMNKEKSQKIELNKGNTLTIVIVLSVFGMTAICGFFLLKNKNVIE